MTTTINNEHKKLNFSSEREQSQACLNSAEHEKNQGRKVLNVPNLRFPEFQGEWNSFLINDVCSEFKSGKNIKADSIFESGEYPVYGGNGLRGYTSSYNHEGSYVLIGRQGALCGNVRSVYGKTYITEHAIAVAGNEKSNTDFLHYLFLKMNLGQYSDQSAQPGLAVNKLLKLKVALPIISEQTKIAKLLSLLDERIATQNKIIEDLKKLKSAISENLFKAVKGDVVILSEICEIIKGKQVNSEFLSEKGKYYVMNGGTEPSGYYSDYNVEANTISISEGGNSCGYVQFNTSPFWSGGHCYTIQKIADNVDHLYLYHYLKSKEDAIMKLRIGSGLPNIQKKDLAMFKIKLPTVEQQKSISTFLSSLERKAEIEERIRNSILDEKRCLLHQMFI